ncbi:alpha-L-fucosidase [Niabella pedocola]|uniref:alpha-L-fucosidase n=1 Tax=Niabella pedocola TaxID=1752077 RepID=A0ABS8PYJ4_9BACT|nr:alpha-L-fucosidase [Niabella pedocola]MCD2425408.1 alpha-L-fucosidase [Niabella pedocola]
MKKRILLSVLSMLWYSATLSAQQKEQQEDEKVKMEHAQIGITEDLKTSYKRTAHPDAQWYPQAGFGMFIHWGISSVKELDLSWPMMAGTQIGWSSNKPSQDSVDRFIAAGDFFAGHRCKLNGTCVTPNQYWEQAKDFNPGSCNPDEWVKLARDAGMQYVVLTTRHHDGFALWPSKYGDFNTRNYLGGRDFVKEFVTACRKYGLKIGLYYSGPDWHFNRAFQSFLYYGVGRDYQRVPSVDADLKIRTAVATAAEKQQHYEAVAAYIKGQVEELLTNYGKIDMIWFDGSADIPKGNEAWKHCISMERIHQLQPGIVVSPRFFGYGDYKTLEGDKSLPAVRQPGWAELCATIAEPGWGYTRAPLKSTAYVLNQLAVCRSNNANFLLNFGPTKDGVFSGEMISRLREIAGWMQQNHAAVTGAQPLDEAEQASVPATARGRHRYLFVMPPVPGKLKAPVLPLTPATVTFKTTGSVKAVTILGKNTPVPYTVSNGVIMIQVSAGLRSQNGDVIDVALK